MVIIVIKLTKIGVARLWYSNEWSFGKIEAGNLERSNVDITADDNILKAQQAFSGVSRLLQTEVDITKRLIDG